MNKYIVRQFTLSSAEDQVFFFKFSKGRIYLLNVSTISLIIHTHSIIDFVHTADIYIEVIILKLRLGK